MMLPVEIAKRPCQDYYCSEPGHQYVPDRGIEWDWTRVHRVAFRSSSDSEPMVTLSAMDEYVIGELRKPGAADEDHVGALAIEADERFLIDGVSAAEAREFAVKALRLAAELLAAADRLEEISRSSE